MGFNTFIKNNSVLNTILFTISKEKAERLLSVRDEWEKIQNERLADILNYAKVHSCYYQALLAPTKITPQEAVKVLKSLPLLTKSIIREQYFDIFSDTISPSWKIWGNTGGSTGEPLKFPRLCNRMWNEMIHQYYTYKYLGGNEACVWNDIIVSIAGDRIPEEKLKDKVFYLKSRNFPMGKYSFSTLYMFEENLDYYVSSLNVIKPSYIRAYSAGALTLAQHIKKKNIGLTFKLKGIYLTSEAFSEQSRRFISEVFHCPVIGQYGHTEMSVYAIQHKDDSIYECMPLYGYTEILDERGNHVEEGQTGEIVVTGFNQIGLPFIRYKTGDIATYKGTSKGIVYIDAIQGRTVDYLYDKEGNSVFLTGAIFGGHIKAFNHIAQWQLRQIKKGKVQVSIIKGEGYNCEIENEIIRFFSGFNIEASLYYVDYIEKQKNGKQKFLIQEIQ